MPLTLTVDTAHPGHAVSPDLYGVFFEEINYGGDGGLYPELIRNRAFMDPATPAQWIAPADIPRVPGTFGPDRLRPDQQLRVDRLWVQQMFARNVGDKVLPVTASASGLYYSATTDSRSGRVYLKIVNPGSQNVPGQLTFGGRYASVASIEALSSPDPQAGNTLANPGRRGAEPQHAAGLERRLHLPGARQLADRGHGNPPVTCPGR